MIRPAHRVGRGAVRSLGVGARGSVCAVTGDGAGRNGIGWGCCGDGPRHDRHRSCAAGGPGCRNRRGSRHRHRPSRVRGAVHRRAAVRRFRDRGSHRGPHRRSRPRHPRRRHRGRAGCVPALRAGARRERLGPVVGDRCGHHLVGATRCGRHQPVTGRAVDDARRRSRDRACPVQRCRGRRGRRPPDRSHALGVLESRSRGRHVGAGIAAEDVPALIGGTADDAGVPGFDTAFGWGVLDPRQAVR